MEEVIVKQEEKVEPEVETFESVMCEKCGDCLPENKYIEHFEKCSSITLEQVIAEKKAQEEQRLSDPNPLNSYDKDQVTCPVCSQRIAHGRNLKRHMISKHGNPSLVICQYCTKSFPSEELLNRHVILQHDNPLTFKCNMCKQMFNEKHYLENHILRIHTSLRRYKCSNCSYGVMTRQTFSAHVKTCVFKDNETEFNANFNDLLINVENRPVVCSFCKTDCSDISALIDHILKEHNTAAEVNKRDSMHSNQYEDENIEQLSETPLIENRKKRIKTCGKEESRKLRTKSLDTQEIHNQLQKSKSEFDSSCGSEGTGNDLFYDSEILKKLFYQKQNNLYKENGGGYNFVSNGFHKTYPSAKEGVPIARENGLSLEMRTVLANALTILYREILLDEDLEKYRCKLCSITCLSATALENHMKRHL